MLGQARGNFYKRFIMHNPRITKFKFSNNFIYLLNINIICLDGDPYWITGLHRLSFTSLSGKKTQYF
ncbi:hypothetical protein RT0418 [Rickettsia typhi str. Wilmington]|uniref:Uncharacterized protein n=1 Tax=Rickettsia typhi (strain ATCC VR-144 / Wilmington) TaxID=257363 RepID=Q68WU7_RICTY|nr:hypothetical protein RT0418 [Rickettsia typhi str. Wilmington]